VRSGEREGGVRSEEIKVKKKYSVKSIKKAGPKFGPAFLDR
jgi:hypothetical protein